MWICDELTQDVCTSWVELSQVWGVPEGFGVSVGWRFLVLVAVAWGFSQIYRFIVNR